MLICVIYIIKPIQADKSIVGHELKTVWLCISGVQVCGKNIVNNGINIDISVSKLLFFITMSLENKLSTLS